MPSGRAVREPRSGPGLQWLAKGSLKSEPRSSIARLNVKFVDAEG